MDTQNYPRHREALLHGNHTHISYPKPKRKKWPWVLGVCMILTAMCGGGSLAALAFGAKVVNDEIESHRSDVTLVEGTCKGNKEGWSVKVKITNSSTTSNRSYWAQVSLEAGENRIGDGHVIVNDLKPGQTKTEVVQGFEPWQRGATCVVTDVK